MTMRRNDIKQFCDELARAYHPHRVVLFGSHANGSPREDSDVDLLVTMDYEGSRLGLAASIIRALNPSFAVDLIIRTEDEVRERLNAGDSFLSSILEHGNVLYEAAH